MTTAAPNLPLPVPRFPGHPIFGNLPSFRRDRAAMQLRVAEALPDAAGLRMGLIPCVMVSNPAFAYEILQTKASAFTKAPGLTVFLKPVLGNGLLTSEGQFHASQRKLLAPAFMHKRISSYADTMRERAERIAASVRDGQQLDVADLMMRLTLEIVGKTLFDTEVGGAQADAVGDALTTAMETAIDQIESMLPVPPFIPTPKNLRLKRAVAQLDEVLYGIIRSRRGEKEDRGDLLSMLLAAQHEDGEVMPEVPRRARADGAEGAMNDKQVRDEAMTLFLAGHETTANALAWTLYLLARNPDARAKVEAEVDALGHAPTYDELKKLPYTLAALKEAMRLYPPAYIIARRVIEPVTIGEHRLRKNTLALVNVLGLHRRPDLWPDPEAYRPERFLGDAEKQLPRCAYMPFGAGPRICIGNHFALMEGHVILATLAQRLRFDRTTDVPVETEPLVTLRPKGGVSMRATVRGR